MKTTLAAALAILLLSGTAVGKGGAMRITSPAFNDQSPIPAVYSCDGRNISPELSIANVPETARSLALLVDDPDAPVGDWVHWIVFNLPPDIGSIPEAAEAKDLAGGVQGSNSWGRTGYGGPCPPGGTHRYYFKLYALDTTLDLPPGADKRRLLDAMQGHVAAEARLMGTYRR